MSRDPKALEPKMRGKLAEFTLHMIAAKIDFILTCTRRSQEEQDALYAQGRTKPGKIVTWTRHSKHIEGKAFDIAILINGKICWNPQLDADKDGVAEYTEAGQLGELVGLKWGGRFKSPDAPHFELED